LHRSGCHPDDLSHHRSSKRAPRHLLQPLHPGRRGGGVRDLYWVEEFQLLDQGDRHLGADLTNVALRTVRAILDHLSEHRELYRLASSWRSVIGLIGITDLLVEQVHSFRVEFGGDHSGSGEAETTADIYTAAGMDGVFSAAVEGALGSDHARIAEMLFSLVPEWMRRPQA
jgi:hypothetical protein